MCSIKKRGTSRTRLGLDGDGGVGGGLVVEGEELVGDGEDTLVLPVLAGDEGGEEAVRHVERAVLALGALVDDLSDLGLAVLGVGDLDVVAAHVVTVKLGAVHGDDVLVAVVVVAAVTLVLGSVVEGGTATLDGLVLGKVGEVGRALLGGSGRDGDDTGEEGKESLGEHCWLCWWFLVASDKD